jgi:Protein of unknown function (DUF3108)
MIAPMRMRGLLRGLAVVVGLASRAIAADHAAVTLRYEVHYGPLRLLSVHVSTAVDGTQYRSRSVMQTEGIVGAIYPWSSESEVLGVRTGGRLQPHRHRAVGRYRNQERLVEIDYAGERVRSRIEPAPEADDRTAVPEALQQATVDPLTASLHAAATGCEGTIPVFDGRRRYDLRLVALAPVELAATPARVYAGPARRCRAQVEAKAGFWQSDPRDSEVPTYLDYWLAVPRPGLPPIPVYLELRGARGTLRIDLVEVTAGATFESELRASATRSRRPTKSSS